MSNLKSLIRNKTTFADLIRHAILAWLLAVTIEYLMLPEELRELSELYGLAQMSFARVLGLTFALFIVLGAIFCFAPTLKAGRISIVAVFTVLSVIALHVSFSLPFAIVCALILLALVVFAIRGWQSSETEPKIESQTSSRVYVLTTVGLSALFFILVSAWSVSRVHSFSTPSYDFGIFAQMFYNMKESGLPLTTLERDGLLSHFAVHVSPIYYLILPFYYIFPTPATLQVMQAAIITSAVIPLWKIGKHHGLSGLQRMLICAILLLYPAFSAGTSYDIHENCFLTPLILWLLYGLDRKSIPITVIAALLTLLVKEDAAVYVAVIALYMILKTLLRFKKKDVKNLIVGISLLVVSLAYFFLVTGYLAKSGDGVMTYRYDNFMYDGSSSLITVIKSIILNPLKTVYECVDKEKLVFIAQTLIPLLGLPLLTRRYERYILLIPYILVNLMSDYHYQHHIFFQYTFGSLAFLIYLTVINVADLKIDKKRTVSLLCVVAVGVVFFASVILPTAVFYPAYAIQNAEKHESIRDILDTIPEDASVSSTTFFTTYLSQREVLYDVEYCTWKHLVESDFVVLGSPKSISYEKFATYNQNNGYDNVVKWLRARGFVVYARLEDDLLILQKK